MKSAIRDLCLLSILICGASNAATLTVANINDAGPGSLRQALIDAVDGDTINFDTALVSSSARTINLTTPGDSTYGPSAFVINKKVAIKGPGGSNPGANGITLNNSFGTRLRFFYVTAAGDLTLENLTLKSGLAKHFNAFGADDAAT